MRIFKTGAAGSKTIRQRCNGFFHWSPQRQQGKLDAVREAEIEESGLALRCSSVRLPAGILSAVK
jgi:hypothetical protein